MAWLVPRSHLTPDQVRAIEASPQEHRIVRGGPGSGKTVTLAHRAQYLIDRFKYPPERLRMFVFTKVLKDYIRSDISNLDLADDMVVTFDGWCKQIFEHHVHRRTPKDQRGRPDFDAIRAGVLDAAERGSITQLLDAALVDEGQDLDITAYRILRKVARHVTVCLDGNQRLYAGKASENEIRSELAVRSPGFILQNTYRCTPYIANMAAAFLAVEKRDAFVRQVRIDQARREAPVVFRTSDADGELRMLADKIRGRATEDSVAILLPDNKYVNGIHHALAELHVETEVQRRGIRHGDHELDFRSSLPKLITYHSAKGLTFDSVFLPRLNRRAFEAVSDLHSLLFVGITRATKWVHASSSDGGKLSVFRTFEQLAAAGMLRLTSDASARYAYGAPTPPTEDDHEPDGSDFV